MDPQPPPAPAQPPVPAPAPPGSWQTPPPNAWQAPPEEAGPAPGVRFAGPGARLVAYIVDGIILGAVFLALTLVLIVVWGASAATTADSDGGVTGAGGAALAGSGLLYFFAIIVISLAYFPWFWARSGQTPGMKFFHIRVVRDADGGPISGTSAMLRLLGYWVNSAVFYIGFIWIFVDKRRRGWHDLIAGTVVIEQP